MKFYPLLGLFAAALAFPALAQQATDTAPANSAAAARDALKQQTTDTDQAALLKQTLTAVDKQYSLIKRGQVQTTYDLAYTYIGQEKINAGVVDGTVTLFNIENDSSHAITNTLSVDYGVLNNLTASASLPFVSKYSQNPAFDGVSNSLGDLGLGARWQPLEAQRGRPSMTVTSNLHLPTGRSPFKVTADKGLASGAGVASFSGGLNVNNIVDPVALFGSLNFTVSKPAEHLSQLRNGQILTKVAPGAGVGFGMGFAYALSYGISTSISFQEAISAGTKLTLKTSDTVPVYTAVKTNTQTSSILNFGLGYRVSPKTTMNVTVGIGLTADSPNLTLDVSLPLSF